MYLRLNILSIVLFKVWTFILYLYMLNKKSIIFNSFPIDSRKRRRSTPRLDNHLQYQIYIFISYYIIWNNNIFALLWHYLCWNTYIFGAKFNIVGPISEMRVYVNMYFKANDSIIWKKCNQNVFCKNVERKEFFK